MNKHEINIPQADSITVCALYKFFAFDDYQQQRNALLVLCKKLQVKGTLLLAQEGINGTIAGKEDAIAQVIRYLHEDLGINDLACKYSYCSQSPFLRTKVRLKQEIVALRVPAICPVANRGIYVEPKDWNELISRDDVIVIDTRNNYEYEIGTFAGAINPNTDNFHELPKFIAQHLSKSVHRHVAMFCTGGIRCEKSTAYLNNLGFENVYHLKGGILKYIEDIPAPHSLWQGDCFVFDDRVSVDHNLQKGNYAQCFACRMPVAMKDMAHENYVKGISCPKCYDTQSSKNKNRATQRQIQVELARQKGVAHIGRTQCST